MNETETILTQKSLMIIFTYASAGLGHLRVTDALYHGLPTSANPILLRSEDSSIGYLHHITSIHPLTRAILEWLQSGKPEELFTRAYRWFLRSRTDLLSQHIERLLDEDMDNPDTILVIATHFGLAHQMAAIKEQVSRTRQVRVMLVVQVTDDSPQHIWYVAGADLIVVPSESTKTALVEYGKTAGLPAVRFEVLPYPVSPLLAKALTAPEYEQRSQQVLASGNATIEVVIPVSGAAVGLGYFRQLMDELYRKSPRFHFHIVAKQSPYTRSFLEDMATRSFITIHSAATDRATVEIYEQVYQNTVVALEVTKPSEQAFKALIDPHHQGGSVLLFSEPVGRQERDNLSFLERHHLLPTEAEQRLLWESYTQGTSAGEMPLSNESLNWRGIRLPLDPLSAVNFIWWSLEQSLFTRMLNCNLVQRPPDPYAHEIMSDGVRQFWEMTARL